jgi:hypothetical protein
MGFQPDIGATVVKAKLTDLGTKYLLTNPDKFEIKKFAAYDDEVDYNLWNDDHPNGNAYYGQAIESLHLLEPIKSSTWQCKYPLIKDFPRDVIRMPYISLDQVNVKLPNLTDDVTITGEVLNINASTLSLLIIDTTIYDVEGGSQAQDSMYAAKGLTSIGGFGKPAKAIVKVGAKGNFSFVLNARIVSADKTATFTLTEPSTGISAGGTVYVPRNNELRFNKA